MGYPNAESDIEQLAERILGLFQNVVRYGRYYIRLNIVFLFIGTIVVLYSVFTIASIIASEHGDIGIIYTKYYYLLLIPSIYIVIVDAILIILIYEMIMNTHGILVTLYENYDLVNDLVYPDKSELYRHIRRVYSSRYVLHLTISLSLIIIVLIILFPRILRGNIINDLNSLKYILVIAALAVNIVVFKLMKNFLDAYSDALDVSSAHTVYILYVLLVLTDILQDVIGGSIALLGFILLIIYLVEFNKMLNEIYRTGRTIYRGIKEKALGKTDIIHQELT